jgi:hypothetical protein
MKKSFSRIRNKYISGRNNLGKSPENDRPCEVILKNSAQKPNRI